MFKLLIDTREQNPLEFRSGVFDEIESRALPFGDYWMELDGKEIPLGFERKSLTDLYGTLGQGYERFKRELERAKENKFTLILIIEVTMTEVFNGIKYSQRKGSEILKQLAMLRVRHDLEFHFFCNRRESARFVEEVFDAVRRNFQKVTRGKNNGANDVAVGEQTKL